MSDPAVSGIDRRSEFLYLAEVVEPSVRPNVRRLERFRPRAGSDEMDVVAENLRLAVPDVEVIFKHLSLIGSDPRSLDARGRFELTRSVLEPENDYCFDLLCSSKHNRQVGLIYRHDRLAELTGYYGVKGDVTGRYLARAAALGSGYLTFSRRVPGDLVALADYDGRLFSICLICKNEIVSLARLDLPVPDTSPERTALELKTVINLKLADLAGSGINLPLSALILNGIPEGTEVWEAVARYFPAGITTPEINRGYLSENTACGNEAAEDYLVALGLTLN
ncbi:MAG: hypothetical protein JSU65_11715 [Candidatus Zixiibacteriota bacterium]|nr:MAG: hypothetical protein JSU65_11715 [candidate division Zixibacteria bacterium]